MQEGAHSPPPTSSAPETGGAGFGLSLLWEAERDYECAEPRGFRGPPLLEGDPSLSGASSTTEVHTPMRSQWTQASGDGRFLHGGRQEIRAIAR